MAQIVLVGDKMVRTGMEAGDIISIHEDDVELTGPGYELAKIIKVEGTADQVRAALAARRRPRKEVRFWKDSDGTWYVLKDEPKFEFSLADLTTTTPTLTELQTSLKDKISQITENKALTPRTVDLDRDING